MDESTGRAAVMTNSRANAQGFAQPRPLRRLLLYAWIKKNLGYVVLPIDTFRKSEKKLSARLPDLLKENVKPTIRLSVSVS